MIVVYTGRYFLSRTSLFAFEVASTFLTYMNCEGPYFVEGFLYHVWQSDVQNKESKKHRFRIYLLTKLADGKISIKKE